MDLEATRQEAARDRAEAAEVRATSEQTVRQQALVVYRKSGLRNRSERSAFFLEDLLLPQTAQDTARTTAG